MRKKLKKQYESPTSRLVELKMETPILTVSSSGAPEGRNDGGDWGTGDWV